MSLSHYVALRGHDLTDLQLRLAARGLPSLGRSEAKVIQTLDALIVTLRRLSGEANVPYPAPALARAGAKIETPLAVRNLPRLICNRPRTTRPP